MDKSWKSRDHEKKLWRIRKSWKKGVCLGCVTPTSLTCAVAVFRWCCFVTCFSATFQLQTKKKCESEKHCVDYCVLVHDEKDKGEIGESEWGRERERERESAREGEREGGREKEKESAREGKGSRGRERWHFTAVDYQTKTDSREVELSGCPGTWPCLGMAWIGYKSVCWAHTRFLLFLCDQQIFRRAKFRIKTFWSLKFRKVNKKKKKKSRITRKGTLMKSASFLCSGRSKWCISIMW